MPPRDPSLFMWAEAVELLDKAERLHRQFFHVSPGARRATWQPPVDMYETREELRLSIALPGVEPDRIDLTVDSGMLIVTGERPLPPGAQGARIHRLELPHGHFERRIELPPGRYEVGPRRLANGLLDIALRKLG
jgi:HSP20 family protein